jgi:MerR family copper efflux transcriptional regulator
MKTTTNMNSSLRIADVAANAGISTATIRYYERVGVLPQPPRAGNGYRLYDADTLERLRFVSRAKQLGCSLEEIADLVTAWEGGECGPVQDRLRSLVADKLAIAQIEILDLITLSADLRRAAAALERHRPVGPCDESCACVSEPVPAESSTAFAIALVDKPTEADVPLACTLDGQGFQSRIDEWHALLDGPPFGAAKRLAVPGGLRIEFGSGVDVTELARLASAEQDCCSFFAFQITIDGRGIALEVTAPPDALDVMHAAFGAPA